MSYTLVSASVLGFELAGMTGGPVIASTVLIGLAAEPMTLLQLAGSPRGRHRAARPQPESRDADETPLLRSLPDRISSTTTDRETLQLLRASRLDGADALERFIRDEVLGAGCQAIQGLPADSRERIADVLTDSALAAWAHPEPALPLTNPGTAPAHHCDAASPMDQPSDQPGLDAHVESLLRTLPLASGGDTAARQTWRSARPGASLAWTQAMHEACWAAHLTGRLRLAAAAQMRGVLAFHAAGLGPVDVASGTWVALSGALQALSVLDVLDEQSIHTLLTPVRNLFPIPLPPSTGQANR